MHMFVSQQGHYGHSQVMLEHHQIDSLVQDCSNSIANALELLQFVPHIHTFHIQAWFGSWHNVDYCRLVVVYWDVVNFE